jgi:hypothetical protein
MPPSYPGLARQFHRDRLHLNFVQEKAAQLRWAGARRQLRGMDCASDFLARSTPRGLQPIRSTNLETDIAETG